MVNPQKVRPAMAVYSDTAAASSITVRRSDVFDDVVMDGLQPGNQDDGVI